MNALWIPSDSAVLAREAAARTKRAIACFTLVDAAGGTLLGPRR